MFENDTPLLRSSIQRKQQPLSHAEDTHWRFTTDPRAIGNLNDAEARTLQEFLNYVQDLLKHRKFLKEEHHG